MSENREPFKRIILGFDESLHKRKMQKIQDYCDCANEEISGIEVDYSIKLSDYQIGRIFIDHDPNPGGFFDEVFSEITSKKFRDVAREDIKRIMGIIVRKMQDFPLKEIIPYIEAKKGKIRINSTAEETLKRQCETSIDSERALKIKQLHEATHLAMLELLAEIHKNPDFKRINIFALYEMNILSQEINLQNINYNKL